MIHDTKWLDEEKYKRKLNNYGALLKNADKDQSSKFESEADFAKRYHEHMEERRLYSIDQLAWKTWFLMHNHADDLYIGYFEHECNWGFDFQPHMGNEGYIIIYSDVFSDIVKTIPFSEVVNVFKTKYPHVYKDDWRPPQA